ncbi:hypothetical protein BJY52DRAFT_1306519 [Lactarius psammicola]|nr:hypothetical protein BJY52DRAFT_1306519 [Lactarius psammicola]
MNTNPPDSLPSTVEGTLAVCPKGYAVLCRFRILVVGNVGPLSNFTGGNTVLTVPLLQTGVGKSSLVSSVFNIGIKDIDIAHDRVGKANIAYAYTSSSNPRFEPASLEKWEVVEGFIRDKCDERLEIKDRLHAIWLCIETPCTGSRLMQTADEQVLALATKLKVAVIVVFTKYDILFNEYYRKGVKGVKAARSRASGKPIPDITRTDVEKSAKHHLDALIDAFQLRFEYVTVSTDERYPILDRIDMLKRLTETTRRCLHEVEGDMWVPWAAAQQINAQQKVNFSINDLEYWINLGKSTVFQGQILLDCLSRIHLDIIEVWNFNDPEEGHTFARAWSIVEPLLTEPQPGSGMSETLSTLSDLTSIASAVAAQVAQVLSGAGIAFVAIKFLCQKYQAIPLTALCLRAYIVDLTLILHNLFIATLVKEPPRPLNRELIADTLKLYKDFDSVKIHRLVGDIASGTRALNLEEKVADVICRQLKMDRE